jgi:hypothetical protein
MSYNLNLVKVFTKEITVIKKEEHPPAGGGLFCIFHSARGLI